MDTKQLRQKILELAIHGKLVPQDPNDEPASVLLERIRAEKERLIKEGKIKKSKKSAKTSDTPHYENVPFEVPEGWAWCKLGDIVNFQGGYAYKSNTYVYLSDWQVIRIGNVKNDNLILDIQPVFVEDIVAKETEKYLLQKDDILFTMTGTKGKRDYFYSVKVPSISQKLLLNQRVGCLRRFSSEFNVDYLCFALKGEYVLDAIFSTETGNVNQGNIGSESTLNLVIAVPPLAEQYRIVNEIKHWFALIDQIEQGKADLQTTIKQTKSKILDLAIHGKLVPQDPNDEPAIELLKRINPDFTPCDNGHSKKLPQGWCSVTVNDVCSIIGGVSYNKADIQDTGIRVLRGGNIQNGKVIDCFDDVFIPLSYQNNDNQVQHGDIIVVASTGSQTLIGKTGFADRDIPKTQIGAFLRIVRPKQKALSPYIRFIFQTDAYKDYIQNMAKGSNINNVKNAHLQNYQICLPPLEEQQRIVEKIGEIFSSLDDIQTALEV